MKNILSYIILISYILFLPLLPYSFAIAIFFLITIFSAIPFVILVTLGIFLDAFLTPYAVFTITITLIAVIGVFIRKILRNIFNLDIVYE